MTKSVQRTSDFSHFPNPKSGGPGANSEFIMTDMRQGLAEIVAVARGQAWTPPEETGVPAT